MTPEKIKELLLKSKIETSDDFTDQLISRIEAKSKIENFTFPFYLMLSGVVAIFLITISLGYLLSEQYFEIIGRMNQPPKRLIFVGLSMLTLLGINYVLKLKRACQTLNNRMGLQTN